MHQLFGALLENRLNILMVFNSLFFDTSVETRLKGMFSPKGYFLNVLSVKMHQIAEILCLMLTLSGMAYVSQVYYKIFYIMISIIFSSHKHYFFFQETL